MYQDQDQEFCCQESFSPDTNFLSRYLIADAELFREYEDFLLSISDRFFQAYQLVKRAKKVKVNKVKMQDWNRPTEIRIET